MELIKKLEDMFPGWGAKRAAARAMMRYYDAGSSSQYFKNKSAGGNQSADSSVGRAGSNLRAIARSLDENHDLAVSVLDTLCNKIIGMGLNPLIQPVSSTGKPNERLAKQLTVLWQDYMRYPETTRTLCMSEMQRLACRTWLRDGEIFGKHIRGTNRLKSFTQVSYAIDLHEPDMVPFDDYQSYNKSKNTTASPRNAAIQGVYKDAFGRPTAYAFFKERPADAYGTSYASSWSLTADTVKVSADNVVHLKFCRRLRQTRGVPILSAVLRRLESIENYEESELVAARINAAFTGFIQKSADFANSSGEPNTNRTMEMSPGMVFDNLNPGESVSMLGTDRPNPGLTDFRNGQLKAIAAGTGTNFSTISKTYEGNYSSQRQEMVESKAAYDVLRTQFINDFLQPIWQEFINMASLQGLVAIPRSIDEQSLLMPAWSTPGTPWIDPLKEAQAQVLLIENNLVSHSEVIRAAGKDPVKTFLEVEAEKQMALFEPPPAPEPAQQDEPADDEQDNEVAANGN